MPRGQRNPESISPECLREMFSLDPETGWLLNKRQARGVKRGSRAGGANGSGYRRVLINGQFYQEHRVIWAIHYGAWPAGEIDHKNCDRADNRIANLRLATRSENMQNGTVRVTNISGVPGVRYEGTRGKWYAYIRKNYKMRSLGRYDSFDEAVAARKRAEEALFGEFAPQRAA